MPVIPPLVMAILDALGIVATTGVVVDSAMGAFKTSSGDPGAVAAAAAKAARAEDPSLKFSRKEINAAAVAGKNAAARAAAELAESKRIMPKIGKVGGAAMMALFALPILKDMFSGGGESPQQMGGMGGEEQQIMQLLAGLQQQAGSSLEDTKSAYNRSMGASRTQDIVDRFGSRQTGFGIRSDLDEIIRGNEDEIARLSVPQPITLVEALARRGILTPSLDSATPLQRIM